MGRRRLGREIAFKAFYRVDLLGQGIEEALAGLGGDEARDAEAVRFAQELLETVAEHREEVDREVEAAAENWQLSRLGTVDRAILRLGAAEILFWRWIPNRVSINEYVDIAKKFGAEESGGFVNAVLDRIAREAETREAEH